MSTFRHVHSGSLPIRGLLGVLAQPFCCVRVKERGQLVHKAQVLVKTRQKVWQRL